MKIAIISDIHGNLEALQTMLARLEKEDVQDVFCLGDIVGYGANPNECLDLIRDKCKSCVIGNHDSALIGKTSLQYFNAYARSAIEWTNSVIQPDHIEYLKSLPLTHKLEKILLVHATPRDPGAWNYIHSFEDALPNFEAMAECETAFIGHSHIPTQFVNGEKRIYNIGSVGQPRDRDPRASAGVFDSTSGEFNLIRESYAIQVAAQKIRDAGLPEFLASRLFIGK